MSEPDPARTEAHLRRRLAEFRVPSEPGNERMAMERVAEALSEVEIA